MSHRSKSAFWVGMWPHVEKWVFHGKVAVCVKCECLCSMLNRLCVWVCKCVCSMVSCAVGMTCFQLSPSLIWFREILWIRVCISCETKRDLFQSVASLSSLDIQNSPLYEHVCVRLFLNVSFRMTVCTYMYSYVPENIFFVIIIWCVSLCASLLAANILYWRYYHHVALLINVFCFSFFSSAVVFLETTQQFPTLSFVTLQMDVCMQ